MLERRHVYVLLFVAPALLLSVIAAAIAVAALAGVLWLFVFGDNPWPCVSEVLSVNSSGAPRPISQGAPCVFQVRRVLYL